MRSELIKHLSDAGRPADDLFVPAAAVPTRSPVLADLSSSAGLVGPAKKYDARTLARLRRRLWHRPAGSVVRLGEWRLTITDGPNAYMQFKDVCVRRIYDFTTDSAFPRIIDGGGNMGVSVLRFRQQHPAARITTFEPDPVIAQLLRQNLARNGADDVEIVVAGLAGEAGELAFTADASAGGQIGGADLAYTAIARNGEPAPSGETAPVAQSAPRRDGVLTRKELPHGKSARRENAASGGELASAEPPAPAGELSPAEAICRVRVEALSRYITEPVDFLKLNIEGQELPVLRDLEATGTIAHVRRMVVEYHGWAGQPQRLGEILNLLDRTGFRYMVHDFDDETCTTTKPPFRHRRRAPWFCLIHGERV